MIYTIKEVTDKTVNTKRGPAKVYHLQVEDENGDGHSHNYGFTKPAVNPGDKVSYEIALTPYGANVETKSMRVISTGGPAPAATSSPSGSGGRFVGGARPFPIPPLHGDRAIIRQNAVTNARELVVGILGTNKEGGLWEEQQMQFDTLASEVIRIARKFEAYSAGDIEMAEALKS